MNIGAKDTSGFVEHGMSCFQEDKVMGDQYSNYTRFETNKPFRFGKLATESRITCQTAFMPTLTYCVIVLWYS